MDHLVNRGLEVGMARHKKISSPASPYISAIAPPTISNKMNGDAIDIKDKNCRRFERVLATESSYACKNGKIDTVLILKEF